jgi:hypothetical protein
VPRWVVGLCGIAAVFLAAAVAFAWITAADRNDTRRDRDHALESLRGERTASTKAKHDLASTRKAVTTAEHASEDLAASAQDFMTLFDQRVAAAHDVRIAALHVDVSAFTDAKARANAIVAPINSALPELSSKVGEAEAALAAALAT